jgi:signal transduction histidine kinase/ligand-binding sensor domain-containing protein
MPGVGAALFPRGPNPFCMVFFACGSMLPAVHRRIFPMPVSRLCFAVMAMGLFLTAVHEAVAAPEDYLVDVWDTENGLPGSTVTAIAQTPDGYLWVGTYAGLARFDGVRFVTFDPVNTPELSQARVQGLFLDANGTLWINTFRGGLTSYRAGVFRNEWPDQPAFDLHTTLAASSSNRVTFVTQFGEVQQRDPMSASTNWLVVAPPAGSRPIFQCADGEGRLWFLTRDGHILQFAGGGFKELPGDGGLAGSHIYTLVADTHGRVWAGGENEIALWNGTGFDSMTPTNGGADIRPMQLYPTTSDAMWVLDGDHFRKMAGREWVAEIAEWRGLLGPASSRAMGAHEDREGGMWFNHYGNGLFHIAPDGQYQRLTTGNDLPGDRVGAWFQSRDGGVWVGMDYGGLARLRERRFHVIGMAEGLPARTAMSVCEDGDGAVWIGTSGGGLCRWSDGKITSYPVGASASANFVFSIFPRAGGGAWLSAAEGEDLYQFRDGRVQRASWDVHGIKSILTDHAGRVWMGTKNGIALWAGNERRMLGTNDTATPAAVRALVETPDGTVWAGADDGTLYRCGTNQLEPFRPRDALAEQPIYSLYADSQGVIWAGTFRGGLLRFEKGVFRRITAKQGLPVDVISQILEDNEGRLWLGTHQGIYCVSRSALNACAGDRTNTVNCVTYGRRDGLPALEFSDGYQPACWRGANGLLWFATTRGVVSVNPDELNPAPSPPPVLIEEMRVDGEPIVLGGQKIVVPPGHKQFDFIFTALNFDAGEKTRFRYRIDGLDADWVDAGTRRAAHYGPLPPGNFRFRVMACNNEGEWNEAAAVTAFTVQPHFYQTPWFLILAGAGILGVVVFAARKIVTAKYRRQLARLEQQHAIERDRARIAKDIHDDVGAGLTQITLLTELARREPERVGKHLDRIAGSARQLTRAMDEIVWAVDPHHDTLNGLMDYISAYTEDFLRTAGIRCRMDLPVTPLTARVEAELRYNLFLAFKETLNNVVKHAQATEVWLRLRIGPKTFTLIVEDNGRGIAAADEGASDIRAHRLASGSGLANLKNRLAAVGGRCEIHSQPGQGTRVEMTVALNLEMAPPVMAVGHGDEVD